MGKPSEWSSVVTASAHGVIAAAALCLGPVQHVAWGQSVPQASSASTKGAEKIPQSTMAFVDVSVIPMDSERVVAGQTVVVEGGKITAMGPKGSVRIPSDARQIDAHGKFLIPGLADMHVHLEHVDSAMAEEWLYLFAANGVTTIRNMGFLNREASPYVQLEGRDMLRLRARVAAGELMGPRIYTSTGWGKFNRQSDLIAAATGGGQLSSDSVRTLIAAYKAAGYDFLKIHEEDPETYQQVVAAAREVGIPVAGHAPVGTPLDVVLAAHQRSIEHLYGYTPATLHPSRIPEVVDETKRAGVWNCPTLLAGMETMAGALTMDSVAQWPEAVRFIPADTTAVWRAHYDSVPPPAPLGDDEIESGQHDWEIPGHGALAATRQLVKALGGPGVGLLAGTDVAPDLFAGMLPGFVLHRELQAMVRTGLTPYQTLAAATRNVAEFFGTLPETGTVAVGKRADLVLLDANPLENIANTMKSSGVVVNGRWLPRSEIDQWLAGWKWRRKSKEWTPS